MTYFTAALDVRDRQLFLDFIRNGKVATISNRDWMDACCIHYRHVSMIMFKTDGYMLQIANSVRRLASDVVGANGDNMASRVNFINASRPMRFWYGG